MTIALLLVKFDTTTDPLRGSYCVRIAITKLRSIALRFSLAWCFASFGISDACLGCCFQEVKELKKLKKLRRYLCLW